MVCEPVSKKTSTLQSQRLYKENLTLPGEFFLDLDTPIDPTCFVQHLREYLQVRPKPTTHHHKSKIFLFKDLTTCSHIFVRVDNIKKPLQPPYEDPYQIPERNNKVFKITIKGQPTTVSMDRIKPSTSRKTSCQHQQNQGSYRMLRM